MKATLLLALSLFALPALAQAAGSCNGQTKQCYSACDRGYVPVVGNTCVNYYDSSRRCYHVRGECQGGGGGGGGGGNSGCRSESKSCYSACDRSYVRFNGADSCSTAYNSTRRCYEAIGYCSK